MRRLESNRRQREIGWERRDFECNHYRGAGSSPILHGNLLIAQFDGSDQGFEGIASLAANKPPRDWVDPDLDQSAIELADMAQKFIRTETYARVKGRPEKRQAMAVVIGLDGRPAPLLEEFDVAESERAVVSGLIERVTDALEKAGPARRSVILAALAELTARYMQAAEPKPGRKKGKLAS